MDASSLLEPKSELNPYVVWTLRIVLIVFVVVIAPSVNSKLAFAMNNAILRFAYVIAIVVLAFLDPVSAIVLLFAFVLIMINRRSVSPVDKEDYADVTDYHMQSTESESTMPHPESYQKPQKEFSAANPSVAGTFDESSAAVADTLYFGNIQSNLVGCDSVQQTEIRTWSEELGPQGMGVPSGYSSLWYNTYTE